MLFMKAHSEKIGSGITLFASLTSFPNAYRISISIAFHFLSHFIFHRISISINHVLTCADIFFHLNCILHIIWIVCNIFCHLQLASPTSSVAFMPSTSHPKHQYHLYSRICNAYVISSLSSVTFRRLFYHL